MIRSFAVSVPLFLLVLTGQTHACMWDRDTLSQEFKENPNITEIITGRFERFPPRYYEMRLERVQLEIATNPENLELYDDLGVACDRLHRGDKAIEWMAKKSAEMDRQQLPADHEHRYRYEANLGTFLIHRWLRDGAAKESIESAKTAVDHIARAIEINPDAHFGREKYQLMAMDWIIARVENPEGESAFSFLGFEGTNYYTVFSEARLNGIDVEEAQRGIAGLIRLGNAWESIDVQVALGQVLQGRRHNQLALLSKYRIQELQTDGKSSFAADEKVESWLNSVGDAFSGHIKDTSVYFAKARKESDAWQKARFDFMEKKFTAGEHPDTHSAFWDNFSYRKNAPKPPFQIGHDQKLTVLLITFLIGILALPILLFILGRVAFKRWRKRKDIGDAGQGAIM